MKTKFYLIRCVLALLLLVAPCTFGANFFEANYELDTVGETPPETADFDISPDSPDAAKGVVVVDGLSTPASPLDGKGLYIYDVTDGANARYVADINGGANVSSVQVDFDFAVNPAITGPASDTEINFTVGMAGVSLTSSSRRAFEFRILQDGGLDMRSEGVSTEIGTFNTATTHHLTVLLNSDDDAALDYDISEVGSGSLNPNTFHIYLDGSKLGEYGFYLDPSDDSVAYNTGAPDLGRVAFYQDTGNTGALFVDNLVMAEVETGGGSTGVEVKNVFSDLDFEDDTAGELADLGDSKYSPSTPTAINGGFVVDGSTDPLSPFDSKSMYVYDFGTESGNSTHIRYNFNGGNNVSEVRVDFDFRPMPVVDATDGDTGMFVALGRAGFNGALNNSDFRPFRLELYNDGTLAFNDVNGTTALGTYNLAASNHVTMLINSHDSQSTAYDLDGLGAGTLSPNTVHLFLEGTKLGEFDFYVTPDPTNAPQIVFNEQDEDMGQIAFFQDTNSKGAMAFDNVIIKRVIDITGPPADPSDLVLTQASPLTMEISWTDNSNNETSFIIERAESGSDEYVVVGTANADETSYTDEGLDAQTEYKYRVRATNGYESAYTNELVVSTTEQLAPVIIDSMFDDFILSGNTSMLSVEAAGQGTLSYQWYIGESGDVSNPIADAVTSDIESPELTENTSIWVRVTNANGSFDSDTFEVEVHVPATTLVMDSGELENAIAAALPGDVIEIANGEYDALEIAFTGSGLEGMPITLRAEQEGKVLLTGSSRLEIGGEWLVVENLVFQGEYTGGDDTIVEFKSGRDATDCVLRGVAILNYVPSNGDRTFWVALHGERNRVTGCLFKQHNVSGVTVVVWLDGKPDFHMIDHNHFLDRIDGNENGWESIRIGTSDNSLSDSSSIVEFNLFEKIHGEIEIISNKSGDNTYRHNTFLNSEGTLTLRHGNGCLVDSNYFLGQNREQTGGVRVHGEDHIIINNYIEATRGRGEGAIALAAGQASPRLNDHQAANRAVVAFNTIYNVEGPYIYVGAGFGEKSNDSSAVRDTNPEGIVIANNIFHAGDRTSDSFVVGENPEAQTWAGNIIFGRSMGEGVTDGFVEVDPDLVLDEIAGIYRPSASSPVINAANDLFDDIDLDIDGQDREGVPDVGADEVDASGAVVISGPITAAEVGPDYVAADGSLMVNRLANQSIRAKVTPDSGAIIAGFVVTGAEPKTMLIRGVGPQLADFDVSGTIADPVLVVYNEAGEEVLRNDDWWSNSGSDLRAILDAVDTVGAFELDEGSVDSALIYDFEPGIYTAHVTSKDGSMGEALLEIYDVSGENSLVNQSARANICDDVKQCITGFSINGYVGQKVLIRAVGPTLADFDVPGALSDVKLELFNSDGVSIGSNDDWSGDEISDTSAEVGAFPLAVGSKDAALIVDLEPGEYTVHATGVQSVTGIALVEVYVVE